MAKATISFSVDTEIDKDILYWLKNLPKRQRSAAIRAAIRLSIQQGRVTIGDVYQVVKDLERRLRTGPALTTELPAEADDWDEPPAAAAALDALGKL
jgi:hypothetical protein